MCISICNNPFVQTHGLEPHLAAKMALASHFEISVKRPGAHINELELRALFTLLRSLARSSGNIGVRFGVLVDSSVVLGIAGSRLKAVAAIF